MTYQFIRYEKRGPVAHVTIDRPHRLNAIHPPASAEMREAFTNFREDPALLVAILTGEGDRAFSAGNDLKYTAEHGKSGETYPDAERMPFGGITSDFTCWKPIIAAVNGYAVGGGLELALACDIVIAVEHATFAAPEPKVGLVAAAGGVHRLPRQAPFKVAMAMLLTGKSIAAAEALRWGIVNEVVPQAELMPAADRWAREIAECAPLSVRAHKQMATEGMSLSLEDAMRHEFSELDRVLASPDLLEGPRAFAEKRKPVWRGLPE